MAGLQGAGKTTTVGKLAKYLREQKKKKFSPFPPTFIALLRLHSCRL